MKLSGIAMLSAMVLSVAALFASGCNANSDASTDAKKVETVKKPTIVLAAFGTSVAEAQAALESIDSAVTAACPDYDVRWAFTSSIILKKLRSQGQTTLFARKVPLMNLTEVYADLQSKGVTDIVVQSLHVSPGQEYNEVKDVATGSLKAKYGLPLLTDDASRKALLAALSDQFKGGDTATVLCGHGNDHHPEFNDQLIEMDKLARGMNKNIVLASVEGKPGTEKAFEDVKKRGAKAVHFVPMMVVAGDHIMNDVMGDEDDSWKKTLGLPATASTGLGSNPKVVELFVKRLLDTLNS